MVSLEIDAVTPAFSDTTRPAPPPSIVTPAEGPVIVIVPVESVRSSGPSGSAIVSAVANTVASNWISLPAGSAARSAWSMQ